MLIVRPAERSDLPAVAALLVQSSDAPYDLAKVIDEKLAAGYHGEPVITMAMSGPTLAAAALTCGHNLRLIGVKREMRGRGAGSAILAEAEERLLERYGQVVAGAEPGNYFTPGIYSQDAGSLAFFRGHGYREKASAVNLIADLRNRPFPPGAAGVRRADRGDRADTIEFIRVTFGPIWAFETERTFRAPSPTVVLAEEEGKIVGFTAWSANNAGLHTVGPAGVVAHQRGEGTGRRLLEETCRQMRHDGVDRMLIQWAAALPFYEKVAGARIAHTFVVMEKRVTGGK